MNFISAYQWQNKNFNKWGFCENPEYYNNIVQNAVEPKKHEKSKGHRELSSLFPKPPSIFNKHKYY